MKEEGKERRGGGSPARLAPVARRRRRERERGERDREGRECDR
jgi:hypothetical protein